MVMLKVVEQTGCSLKIVIRSTFAFNRSIDLRYWTSELTGLTWNFVKESWYSYQTSPPMANW